MRYVDYREKLGLGFNDADKTKMLFNKIIEFLKKVNNDYKLQEWLFGRNDIEYLFCQEVGESTYYGDYRDIMNSFQKEQSIAGIISKFIVLINLGTVEGSKALIDLIKGYLESLNIPYELIEDEDGYFIFPKGAKELDDALVSEPLEWLSEYPQTQKEWIEALKVYSSLTDNNASDVADKFRKALERFFQEFFGKTKSLENLKSEYGAYLKVRGIPAEISNNFETLQKSYTDFMNNYAKHHNKTSKNVLEYIMYQTGNIIRLLITLKKEENNNVDLYTRDK